MTSRRWPGIVPAAIVIVAMILLWVVWIGGRVALPDSTSGRTAVSSSTSSSHSDCPEESRV